MHINVKNIILAKLIAQYFNLIISENRKNVVKSFPFAGAPAPESSALSAGSIHSAVRVHMTMTRGWWPASWNYCYLYELHFRLRQPNGQTFQRECSRLLPPLFYYIFLLWLFLSCPGYNPEVGLLLQSTTFCIPKWNNNLLLMAVAQGPARASSLAAAESPRRGCIKWIREQANRIETIKNQKFDKDVSGVAHNTPSGIYLNSHELWDGRLPTINSHKLQCGWRGIVSGSDCNWVQYQWTTTSNGLW